MVFVTRHAGSCLSQAADVTLALSPVHGRRSTLLLSMKEASNGTASTAAYKRP